VLFDAAEAFTEKRARPEQTECRCIDGTCFPINLVTQHKAQAAEAGTLKRLGEYGLRVEAGNERLRADQMRDCAGGEANGAVGAEMNSQSRKRRQHQRDGGGNDPFPGRHAALRC
jgi:hypothetical protein